MFSRHTSVDGSPQRRVNSGLCMVVDGTPEAASSLSSPSCVRGAGGIDVASTDGGGGTHKRNSCDTGGGRVKGISVVHSPGHTAGKRHHLRVEIIGKVAVTTIHHTPRVPHTIQNSPWVDARGGPLGFIPWSEHCRNFPAVELQSVKRASSTCHKKIKLVCENEAP